MAETREQDSPSKAGHSWLSLAGIVLLGLNLRTAVTSVGALLGTVRADLAFSATLAGLLTTLPALCFAAFGAAGPVLTRRFGSESLVGAAAVITAVGLGLRALAPSAAVLLGTSVLALSGAGVANVVLPALVKRDFPRRVGLVTGAYTTALAAGTTGAAAATVPLAGALGSWRGGLGIWAPLAALAAVPWLLQARHRDGHALARQRSSGLRVSRRPLAWALALFFGSQSANAYVVFGWLPQVYTAAGEPAATAALLLAVASGLAIPLSLLISAAAERLRDQRGLIIACVTCYVAAYLGLLLAPAAGAWVWAVLLGLGGGAFPLALAMIGLRGADASVTAQLSSFAQSVGYLLAAGAPLLVGVLFGVTGGWTAPLALMLATVVPMLGAGLVAGRDRVLAAPSTGH